MNPDSGIIHPIEEVDGVDRIAEPRTGGRPPEQIDENVEATLSRALELAEAEIAAVGEPTPGTPVPLSWPRLEVGDRVGPIGGWWWTVADVDVEDQAVLIRPKERASKKSIRGRRRGRR